MVSMLHRARLKLKQIRNLFCVYSTAGLQRVRLGAFERYGEVLSGAVHRTGWSGVLDLARSLNGRGIEDVDDQKFELMRPLSSQ